MQTFVALWVDMRLLHIHDLLLPTAVDLPHYNTS